MRSTLNYVAELIRRHRKKIASAGRLLGPGQKALLVLVHVDRSTAVRVLDADALPRSRSEAAVVRIAAGPARLQVSLRTTLRGCAQG
jgi:hypothetical protein